MSPDAQYMRLCLALARRGYGRTSPNPMVGAVLVKQSKIIGRGWHHRAGLPHAEIEALRETERSSRNAKSATLYVTLEPCSTQGRTPPCTDALIAAGIHRVVVGAVDPNPQHRGRGLAILRRAGIQVEQGLLADECTRLNEVFNYWIVQRRPYVTVKAAMTLDGKIATPSGESRWITGAPARAYAMKLRAGVDAILVGINTVLADDPELSVRGPKAQNRSSKERQPRRIILDTQARTPLEAKVVRGAASQRTTIVVGRRAPEKQTRELSKRGAEIVVAPSRTGRIDLKWVLSKLGREDVTSLLVEGGGEVNASFLLTGLAQRIAFFYAPKILGGATARKAVAGIGANNLDEALDLDEVRWRRLGKDLLLLASVRPGHAPKA